MGVRDCFTKAWSVGQLLLLLAFVADLVCLAAGATQVFRALR
jgi:hypothetical protein